MNSNYATPMGAIRCLGTKESRTTIDAWFNQCKALLPTTKDFQPFIDKTWTSSAEDAHRGFKDVKEGPAISHTTKEEQNYQVESMIE